ncbi:hypothetical protein EPI10_001188 [Gossypium australe]|uniref:Uncharacterized protein n=1 Tax=Gossypium australe TaxID=47621 RepID=A0A5B6VAA9_9ROSI|nr:hypothetical protein EPI10_001188 [Gossypium australe]
METPANQPNSRSGVLIPTQASNQNSVLLVAKMLFYLTMLNLAKFLEDDLTNVKEGKVDDVTAIEA